MNVFPNCKWKIPQEKVSKDLSLVYSVEEETQNIFTVSSQAEIWAWAF